MLKTGISNGQQDYSDLSEKIALTFFPWNNPEFAFGDAAFWIVAALTMLLAIVPGSLEVAATGLTAFAGAGIQQIAYSLTPGYADLFSLFGFY